MKGPDERGAVISGDEVVWRRLSDDGSNMIAHDAGSGTQRPSSAAFHPDTDGVSVYRVRVLSACGLGPESIVNAPGNLVYALSVRNVRRIEPLDVEADPLTGPGPSCRGRAHALIVGWTDLSRRERIRRQRPLAECAEMAYRPKA